MLVGWKGQRKEKKEERKNVERESCLSKHGIAERSVSAAAMLEWRMRQTMRVDVAWGWTAAD